MRNKYSDLGNPKRINVIILSLKIYVLYTQISKMITQRNNY